MNKLTQIYHIIPEDMYKDLTQKYNLTGALRSLFSHIDNYEQYEYLLNEFKKMRQGFIELQPEMVKGVSENLIGSLPLIFIKDNASRSGATYLRWRNMSNSKSGESAWKDILLDPQQPQILKDSLIQAEKERITLNMQMAIISHIIRQLGECRDKLAYIEQFSVCKD